MDKQEIAVILHEMGMLLELRGENPFKIRSFQKASQAIGALTEDLGTVIGEGRLRAIPGVGQALAENIELLYKNGELEYYTELKESVPAGLLEMAEIPGLGPKKIRVIYEKLKISTLDELKRACLDAKLRSLSGFGAKTEEGILRGIERREEYGKRHLWWDVSEITENILRKLRDLKVVAEAEVVGSMRRKLETVGGLDLLVATASREEVVDWFVGLEEVEDVIARETDWLSVEFKGKLQVNLRVVTLNQFFCALHYFTGAKAHNEDMGKHALSMGLRLNEVGLFKKEEEIVVRDEETLFKLLKLEYIPPELREGKGEVECAKGEGMPVLVEVADIRGVFHNHTLASDGKNSLEEMVRGAESLGFEYLGIADHSKSSYQANGLDEARLMEQVDKIENFNKSKVSSVYVFAGTECDILKDGRLDFDDDLLAKLDYVVASVHSSFSLPKDDMTKRIIRAIESPYVTMLGHVTGRLLLKREAYAVDIEKVIDAAIANGVIIELNANPRRLDMDWRYWKKASEKGLKCSINPDAHSVGGLSYYRAGVNIARKGWLTKENILNVLPLEEVKGHFLKKKQRR